MRLKNTQIQSRILSAAKQEFLIFDFRDASMRRIASVANVSLSNIYNYFDSKDALFVSILTPLLQQLNQKIQEQHNQQLSPENIFCRERILQEMNGFVDLLHSFRDELFLLFNRANGSSLEAYFENSIDMMASAGLKFIERIRLNNPNLRPNVSHHFLRLTSLFFINMLKEIATDQAMTNKEINILVEEYIIFCMAGWEGLASSR